MELDYGAVESSFTDKEGNVFELPFKMSLDDFQIAYYEGTYTPMDYISRFTVTDGGRQVAGEVSMNNVFSFRHYRFYQSGYDADGNGTILSVSHDPWGIGLTYTGYALLLLTMVAFFFQKGSRFRKLLSEVLRKSASSASAAAVLLGAFLFFPAVDAAAAPEKVPAAFPKESAARFGNLYMLYNDRVCPVQTFAKDFTIKMCGKSSYKGLTAEQVLTGWLFYYNDWEDEPFIKIKSGDARRTLGIDGKFARLSDYFGSRGTFKTDEALDSLMTGLKEGDKRGLEEANEKLNIVSMVCAGTVMKVFPHKADGSDGISWYAQNSKLPSDLPHEEWVFIRKSLDYVYEMALKNDFGSVDAILDKVRLYQQKELSGSAVPAYRINAEKVYNRIDFTRGLAMFCTFIGILAFVWFCRCLVLRKKSGRKLELVLDLSLLLIFFYLTAVIVLRGIVGDHLPLSNGYETMQFLSWVTMLLTLIFRNRFHMVRPFGWLLSGLALMVSMMGGTNPQITQLMPVLASPLLSIHVMVIMIAYCLLAFTMLDGITAVVLHFSRGDRSEEISYLKSVSELILYPAIFLLAIGIFIGAVWANMSWGRYWGWDPKETWALITMLIYSLAVHSQSLPVFRKPMFFHIFCIAAFLSVLITYFGVNFFLGGMHSYA